jgi:hypothetical protein
MPMYPRVRAFSRNDLSSSLYPLLSPPSDRHAQPGLCFLTQRTPFIRSSQPLLGDDDSTRQNAPANRIRKKLATRDGLSLARSDLPTNGLTTVRSTLLACLFVLLTQPSSNPFGSGLHSPRCWPPGGVFHWPKPVARLRAT